MAYPFLSPSWQVAVEVERDKLRAPIPEGMERLRFNLSVLDGPPGLATQFTLVGAAGGFRIAAGRDPSYPMSATMPYDVAYGLFVDGDFPLAISSFLREEIVIDGDVGELLVLEGALSRPTPAQLALLESIRRVTAPKATGRPPEGED